MDFGEIGKLHEGQRLFSCLEDERDRIEWFVMTEVSLATAG